MMDLNPNIDIFVGNTTVIDMAIFELWVKSILASDAADIISKGEALSKDFVRHAVLDQYRTLGLLEKYLKNPRTLEHQVLFQLTPTMQKQLITRYYTFDDIVIREILGKKLSKSTCQNVDEISEITGVRLRCCLRQFDNCRRVFKVVEEMSGNLVENIENQFLLPENIAWAYAAVVFLANHRFECTKKRLSYLHLEDFIFCCQQLIDHWTYGSAGSSAADMDVDIDREFLHELRGAKLLTADKDIVEKCKQTLLSSSEFKSAHLTPALIDNTCKVLCRNIASIGSGLYRTKELRDLFLDIVEKIIDPARSGKWSSKLLSDFFVNFIEITEEHPHFVHFKSSWSKYIRTMHTCVMQLFHS